MLPDTAQLTVFVAAAVALLVTPGPAVLYIVARSVDQGRMAGVVSAWGITTGGLIHVLAAALGLSALLVKSALAFAVVKYVGAGYLVYLGVRRLLARDPDSAHIEVPRAPLAKLYRDGVVVNILNPKTALFFFAFLPQFVDVNRGSVALQIITLGTLFCAMGMISDGAYALVAGSTRGLLKRNTVAVRATRYITGSVYILLGFATALSGSKTR